jgi:hypothetical protein
MKKRQAFFMTDADLDAFGQRASHERPTVRFFQGDSPTVLRAIPAKGFIVDILDALLNPGLDLPDPDIWIGPEGVGIRLIRSMIHGDLLRSGELTTVFDEADPGQRVFVDDVFRALRLVTKPHVAWPDGKLAPPRIGPDAERWWRAGPGRRLMYWNSDEVVFRLQDTR